MARVQNTLIGKSSGSVGGATFSTWKGVNVLKSKAISVANPKTNAQQLQRSRMTLIVAVFRAISGIVNIGFKSLAIKMSEYNAFTKVNILGATVQGGINFANMNYPALAISRGTIGTIPLASIAGTNASANVVITWDDELAPIGSTPDDIACLAVYNQTQDVWGFATDALRSVGTDTVVMPSPSVTADILHGYLFFKASDSDEVSDNTYGQDAV